MDLEEAYDRYAAPLYRHALAITRSGADAEDAVQTAFVKLASRLEARAPITDMEAYLHVAVRRESVRLVDRRLRATLEPSLEPAIIAPLDGMRLEEVDALNRALAALPAEQREVVLLHNYEGMTF